MQIQEQIQEQEKEVQTDKRNAIITKEVWVSLALYLLFFLWWYVTAYGLGENPENYSYVFGFPAWFFYSCIVGYILISGLLALALKYLFQDISIEAEDQ